MKKDLLKMDDLSKEEILEILNIADQLKYELKHKNKNLNIKMKNRIVNIKIRSWNKIKDSPVSLAR